jgi:hypothetical protein
MWDNAEEWTKDFDDFSITVKRWESPTIYPDKGKYRWNIYVYIYPEHPFIMNNRIEDLKEKAYSFPMHGGVSYFRIRYNDTKHLSSVQVGCDYDYFKNARFSFYKTIEEAKEIFEHAEYLINWLNDENNFRATQ